MASVFNTADDKLPARQRDAAPLRDERDTSPRAPQADYFPSFPGTTPTSEAKAPVTIPQPAERVDSIFGSDVFSRSVMRQRLPKEVYRSLLRTIDRGEPLDPAVADVVAASMKDWAVEIGRASCRERVWIPV